MFQNKKYHETVFSATHSRLCAHLCVHSSHTELGVNLLSYSQDYRTAVSTLYFLIIKQAFWRFFF